MGALWRRSAFLILALVLLISGCRPSLPTPQKTPTLPPAQVYPWWNGAVFYEVFVRSFSDSNGDGKGDLNGLTAKLDYLNDGDPDSQKSLGVKGLWLMPVFPSPSYHGYDVTNFRAVNPDYGTVQDLKRLLAEAHKRGMRVILDFPLNHTSNQHPWFTAASVASSPYRDWYIWSDKDPGYLGPFGETVWHPSQPGGFYYGIFSPEMPDLNYQNPAVTKQMEDVARFWLKDVGVDGFRLDGAPYLIEDGEKQVSTKLTHQWYQNFRTFYKGLNPEALTVGEVYRTSFEAATYAQGDQLDLVFDFDLAGVVMQGVASNDAVSILGNMRAEMKYFKPGQVATFLTNHDMDRVMTKLGGDQQKGKAAAAILLTSPGVPFIYYGEEIGMTGAQTPDSPYNPDAGRRTPFQWTAEPQAGFTSGQPWTAVQAGASAINVASEAADPNSLLAWYRQLVFLRNHHEALRVGDFFPVDATNRSVFAAIRSTGSEKILVLLNLGDQPVNDLRLSLAQGPLKGKFQLQSLAGAAGPTAVLTANDQGGFSDYRPVQTLPANANLVYLLTSAPFY